MYWILIIIALYILYLFYNMNKSDEVEKFRPYYNGTRLCNNRGCDTRYVEDKGTYYCPNKEIFN